MSEKSKFSNWLNDRLKDEFNTDKFHALAWEGARKRFARKLRFRLPKQYTVSGKPHYYQLTDEAYHRCHSLVSK